MKVKVHPDGTITHIYTEKIDLSSIGKTTIGRASHVEPDKDNKWIADLSPSSGPVLRGFDKRSEALAAEVEWMEKNIL